MSKSRKERTYRDYILDVRVVEETTPDGDLYRFEAPNHTRVEFEDPETAQIYADVYFDTNGFEEEGTGERGVPPTIVLAGRDTLVAYLLTRPDTDIHWIASFYGETPEKIQRYVSRVRKRAASIREAAQERGVG